MNTAAKQAQRSSAPWEAYAERAGDAFLHIANAAGHVATAEYARDAAFIVTACNAHDDLVAELEGCAALLLGMEQRGSYTDFARQAHARMLSARAALAKVQA